MEELSHVLQEYGRRLVIWYEPIEGDSEGMRLTYSERAPQEIPMIVGDAIHNLRAALDIMICDIARIREKSSDKLKFPFASNSEIYERIVRKGEIRRLGKDVGEALLLLKAYKGGNLLLRGMHDLDIADKHEMIIPVISTSWGKGYIQMAMEEFSRNNPKSNVRFASIQDSVTLNSLDVEGTILPREVVERNYAKPYRSGRPATALIADGLPFARQHVLPTVKSLAQMTLEIVDSFATQFGGGDRNSLRAPSGDNKVISVGKGELIPVAHFDGQIWRHL
jgi:hypothetical protein